MGLRRTGKVYLVEELEDTKTGCGYSCGCILILLIIGLIFTVVSTLIFTISKLLVIIIPFLIVALILWWLSKLD